MADIFVSYTSSDSPKAQWIARELQALGHEPHIHEWEIKSGDNIYAWMERRHDAADHVLCVLSDAYMRAPYSTLERHAALWQAAAKRPGFVLLVAVEPCRQPTLSDHLRHCELFGVPEEAARQRLRDFLLAQNRSNGQREFPWRVVAASNITRHVHVPTHFVGRDGMLRVIDAALSCNNRPVALYGLRGVGKTTLAVAYADRNRSAYRATWWIRAEDEPTTRADLVASGVKLNWVAANEDDKHAPSDEEEKRALSIVMGRMRQEGEGILLIFDNAKNVGSLRPHLPRGSSARIIVTSNDPKWRSEAEPVEIPQWPGSAGADYLIARTNRKTERQQAEAVSFALGGLPLAHVQAAAYCERLNVPLGEYLQRFLKQPDKFLDDVRHAPTDYHEGRTVTKTFSLAIEEATRLHPAAQHLIMHAALLTPGPIPLFLFKEGRKAFGEPLASLLDGEGLDETIVALREFALVSHEEIADEREPDRKTDTIQLHLLVREVAAEMVPKEDRDNALSSLLSALTLVYPEICDDNTRTRARARRLDAIALALVISSRAGAGDHQDLLRRLGHFGSKELVAIAREERESWLAQFVVEDVLPSLARQSLRLLWSSLRR